MPSARRRHLLALLAAPAFAPGVAWGQSLAVQGAGASFPSKVYEAWARAYEKAVGTVVAYKATGSGDGIKQAVARKVDFGGTDAPLAPAELEKQRLVQIPMLVGGVVPVFNLPGLVGSLQLDGATLAELFMGRIANWNDARIAALNPGLNLPALAVKRVVRADKSGTTDGFSRYLAAVSERFGKDIGAGQLPAWPGEPLRGEGNDGVVQSLRATPGGIAYVSYDRVLRDKLSGAHLLNASGRFVSASEEGFRAAIIQSDMHRKGDDLASLLNRAGVGTWPITLTSFVLVDAAPGATDRATATLRYLYWCLQRGDELTRGTGFAPLPVTVQARLAARFSQVRSRDGMPLSYQAF